jgi:hypothetical protein
MRRDRPRLCDGLTSHNVLPPSTLQDNSNIVPGESRIHGCELQASIIDPGNHCPARLSRHPEDLDVFACIDLPTFHQPARHRAAPRDAKNINNVH